ncbi:uncharacterized protein TEOVI_000334900 [Trypanosoma equiperdum]|uniref:Uncharacterized protein n=1 Tax=Trypanosoma equiperdum TaxID=5694 RepID=A0A1G4IHM6_TRYEQ|nr:hypothetical protein, conserved [Trypanosoma equiperdum]
MGRRSDLRSVAVVAIQRWQGRRLEISQAMRLLGALHIMKKEQDGSDAVQPLHGALAGNAGSGGEDVMALQGVEMLMDIATEYARRLHRDNYEKRRLGSKAANIEQRVELPLSFQRQILLPDAVVAGIVDQVVSSFSGSGDNKSSLGGPSSVATRMVNCWGTAGNILLAQLVGKRVVSADSHRRLLHFLKCAIKLTKITVKCSVSPRATAVSPMVQDDELEVHDVPPLPKPPVVPERRPLKAASGEVTDAGDGDGEGEALAEKVENIDVNAAADVSDRNGDSAADSSDSSTSGSSDSEGGGSSDDDYSDDKYYRDRKKREEARMARIATKLNMDDAAVRAAKTSRDAVAAGTAAASKQREKEAAEEHKSYIQMFGDVGQVLFPALTNMKRSVASKNGANNATSVDGFTTNPGEPLCCVVCELYGEVEELLVCRCGNKMHRDCGSSTVDGTLYCSKYCHAVASAETITPA